MCMPGSNKTLWTLKFKLHTISMCYKLFVFDFQICKKIKTFLTHRPYRNRWQARLDLQTLVCHPLFYLGKGTALILARMMKEDEPVVFALELIILWLRMRWLVLPNTIFLSWYFPLILVKIWWLHFHILQWEILWLVSHAV